MSIKNCKIGKKSEILEVIKEWKLSKSIIDVTDKGLLSLAEKIISYELKKRIK